MIENLALAAVQVQMEAAVKAAINAHIMAMHDAFEVDAADYADTVGRPIDTVATVLVTVLWEYAKARAKPGAPVDELYAHM